MTCGRDDDRDEKLLAGLRQGVIDPLFSLSDSRGTPYATISNAASSAAVAFIRKMGASSEINFVDKL